MTITILMEAKNPGRGKNMTDKKTGVWFDWEDDGNAQVSLIECKCGYTEKPEDMIVCTGDSWICPKCKNELIFKWKGMEFCEVQKK